MDPANDEQWQEAVNVAWVMQHVAAARDYGLIDYDGDINTSRCDWLLARGKELGFSPERGVIEYYLAGRGAEKGNG